MSIWPQIGIDFFEERMNFHSMPESPEEKPLQTTSFVVHATRGLVRDQTMRRKAMFALLVMALVMLFSGSTFLQGTLNPREHPVWFTFYWFACAWITMTAVLLALFDMLAVRAEARKTKKALREQISTEQNPDSPGSTSGE